MVVFGDLRFDYRVFREAEALATAGHRLSIVTADFTAAPLPEWDGFELHRIPVDRSASLRRTYPAFWRRAGQLLRTIKADAYHAHDLDTLWPASRAARRRDVPLVYDSHELWTEQSSLVDRPLIRGFWSHLERRLIGRVHHTIAVSPAIVQTLTERYGLKQVSLVRNLPMYRPPVASNRIRDALGLPADRPIALYQGGFLTANGLDRVIRAAATLDDGCLVLLGDGPTEEALRRQVKDQGLQEQVYFLPRVPFSSLHEYTCSADLGICLIQGTGQSFYHSLPNKLFEYLMAGLPVLASDFPQMGRVVRQEGVGRVVDPQDEAAVARQMQALLADTTARQAYAQAALKAARKYNWENEAAALTAIYANV